MMRGTIAENNIRWGIKNLFRRVVASFVAEGTGEDTLDITYEDRQ
jgi:hypothetical protein